jgi:hypothetical protein
LGRFIGQLLPPGIGDSVLKLAGCDSRHQNTQNFTGFHHNKPASQPLACLQGVGFTCLMTWTSPGAGWCRELWLVGGNEASAQDWWSAAVVLLTMLARGPGDAAGWFCGLLRVSSCTCCGAQRCRSGWFWRVSDV